MIAYLAYADITDMQKDKKGIIVDKDQKVTYYGLDPGKTKLATSSIVTSAVYTEIEALCKKQRVLHDNLDERIRVFRHESIRYASVDTEKFKKKAYQNEYGRIVGLSF